MSLSDEEKDMCVQEAVDNLYDEIITTGHMTKYELLAMLEKLFTEKGA